MYSFLISIAILILGYIIYGKIVDRIFCPDPSRTTPANRMADGVDYVPMPTWKVFMIQFLNIAGTGPIFGAIMGAKFGPSCFLWIVFGSIFAGGVHDYLSGMLSIRHDGATIPQLASNYLGKAGHYAMTGLVVLLLLLVGVVFVYSPALIIGEMAPLSSNPTSSIMFWVIIIFLYYVIATLLPIDKLIGRIYPLFAFALLFMAFGLMICLFVKWPAIPEFWDGLANRGPEVGLNGQNIFPCLFITVACGAISGFHSTQSPLMARCLDNEKNGRRVFYGSMITEGLVALIWAAVSSYFFFDGGMEEVGATSGQAPVVVTSVSKAWLGTVGSILAVLGVVAAPITSGDTAFRSARIVFANLFKLDQKKHRNRLVISIPIFCAAMLLLWFNIADENGFNTIWRYFGWANQTLAAMVLWIATIWMLRNRKVTASLITFLPAGFMTVVSVTYICVDKTGFQMPLEWTGIIAAVAAAAAIAIFAHMVRKHRNAENQEI